MAIPLSLQSEVDTMRVIKIGDKYLGLVDRQGDALRFPDVFPASDTPMIAPVILGARFVKINTIADRTAESMRGLASDVEGDNGGGDQS